MVSLARSASETAFDAICEDRLEEHPFVWRTVNLEVWLRTFFGAKGGALTGRRPEQELARLGDEAAVKIAGTAAAEAALKAFRPNPGRHLFQQVPGIQTRIDTAATRI